MTTSPACFRSSLSRAEKVAASSSVSSQNLATEATTFWASLFSLLRSAIKRPRAQSLPGIRYSWAISLSSQ